MELSLLFDDVDRIMPNNVIIGISTKRSISVKKATNNQILPKTVSSKKTLREKKLEEETSGKKPKAESISAKIIEIIEELAEVEDTEAVIEKHITKSLKDGYAEIFHMQQYHQQLSQYRQFLNAYLKGYKDAMAIDGGAKMAHYDDDPFDKTDVPVPKRDFGVGQEVMTNSEVRDIVRRKRMNWLLGNEHNYVSPDEKERYKFWKLFSKFNYVLAEGCMFNL